MAENTEAVAENNALQSSFSLTIGDIENAVKAIEYACNQGAYKGVDTMMQVLTIRERLLTFLREATAQVAPAPENTPEEVAS